MSLDTFKHLRNQTGEAKITLEKEIDNALETINNPAVSNLAILPIIYKVLDIAPFVLMFFPELKTKILEIAIPVQSELNDFIDSLQPTKRNTKKK